MSAATPIVFEFTASNGKDTSRATSTVTVSPAELGFTAIAKNKEDLVTVPTGYAVGVLYRLGDPIAANVSPYANDGGDTNFAQRAGDHHDGMSYYGLAASGATPALSNSRGLLVMNHENITESYLHPNGPTNLSSGVRPTAEVLKEMECHGVSVIEITRGTSAWSYSSTSSFNRRITPFTPTSFSGPVAGSALLYTAYATNGRTGRGTINNCANGRMPWNTYLTAEENWAGYFRRDSGDNTRRAAAVGAKSVTAFSRYGLSERAGNYRWTFSDAPTSGDTTRVAKFNATIDPTKAADGTQDFRNLARYQIRVDVVGLIVLAHTHRRNHRDEILRMQQLHDRGVYAFDFAHHADVDKSTRILFVGHLHLARAYESTIFTRQAYRLSAIVIDEHDNILLNFATQYPFNDFHRFFIGDTHALNEGALLTDLF
mgnify:CR=1 FL=1